MDGEEDMKKGTQLLEIYALEIQMYTAQVIIKRRGAILTLSKRPLTNVLDIYRRQVVMIF